MRNPSRFASLCVAVGLSGLLAACGQQPRSYGPEYVGQPAPGYQAYPDRGIEYGSVLYIEGMQAQNRTSGAGAILGAVVGGVLGNQVGGGTGRAAATAIGAVGGAVAGNAIEGRNSRTEYDTYRITVRLDQGGQRVYDVPSPGDLRPGDRVRLDGGQISRM
ncbi:glycine zipper 2TM domain-containing protein [Acidovorax sp. MR-S7]|uniref:glycine zipper 2TM domain-containing protein n=1 Tax=unclassified Acidovorax TaxID=2684926 RepID=UPI00036A2A04|nr:glycine zipper 2TM domain-containing protein [Acidovorax sp. MR-S7]GAD20779.1 predicted outer membrane lipoprotein [Acidovorax sp. MR-S7]